MRRGSEEKVIRDNFKDFYKRERNGSSIAKIYHCQPIKHSLTLDFSQPYAYKSAAAKNIMTKLINAEYFQYNS